MTVKPLACIVAMAVVGLGIVLRQPLTTHVKTLLLISQEFPQVPVKPLGALTAPPVHQKLTLSSQHGAINADLFLPAQRFGLVAPNSRPAVILAMGVKTREEDRPIILHFAETLGRLGFVVIWPRLAALDDGVALPEEPATLAEGFRYLEGLDLVDKSRISFVGFSVGSSTAFVAMADPQLADRVHALVFFGGYYDIFEYFVSIASRSLVMEGQEVPWEPAEGATSHVQEILKTKEADGILKIFDARTRAEAEALLRSAPQAEISGLGRYNPAEHRRSFTSRIFVLHDMSDPYVPYVESIKLHAALGDGVDKTFLLTNLFEHVQPKAGLSWQILAEARKLYGFIYQALSYL